MRFSIREYIKSNKDKCIDILLQSFAWMIVSVVAAYPDLCINFKMDLFSPVSSEQYCNDFLRPVLLFLVAFIFDFYFSIKDLNIGQKRGGLFKIFTLLLCTLFIILSCITIITCACAKLFLFILLWFNISLIKGLTVLIPGEDAVIKLEVPINQIKS